MKIDNLNSGRMSTFLTSGLYGQGTDRIPFYHFRKVVKYIDKNKVNLNLDKYDLLNIKVWGGYGYSAFDANERCNTLSAGILNTQIPLNSVYNFIEIPSKKNVKNSPFGEFLVFASGVSIRNVGIWKMTIHPIKKKDEMYPKYKINRTMIGSFVNSDNLEFGYKRGIDQGPYSCVLTENANGIFWDTSSIINEGWQYINNQTDFDIGRFDPFNQRLLEGYNISKLRNFINENFISDDQKFDKSNDRLQRKRRDRGTN